MTSYKGDAHLEKLLHTAGETRPLAAIKDILRGVNASPEDLGDSDRWMRLVKTGTDADTKIQLAALKTTLAAEDNADVADRLGALRAEMKKRGIDGFFIPRADEF